PQPLRLDGGRPALGRLRAAPALALLRGGLPVHAQRRARRDRSDDRLPRDVLLPAVRGGGLHRGHRADRALPGARGRGAAAGGDVVKPAKTVRLGLAAPDGAPLDLDLVARSHGWYDLPPFSYDRAAKRLAFTYLEEGA